MRVTIDRTKWNRGRDTKFLLKDCKGNMCVLGFVCNDPSKDDEWMLGRLGPTDLFSVGPIPKHLDFLVEPVDTEDERWGHQVYWVDSQAAILMIQVNDSPDIPDELREKILKALAEPHGIELEFVG